MKFILYDCPISVVSCHCHPLYSAVKRCDWKYSGLECKKEKKRNGMKRKEKKPSKLVLQTCATDPSWEKPPRPTSPMCCVHRLELALKTTFWQKALIFSSRKISERMALRARFPISLFGSRLFKTLIYYIIILTFFLTLIANLRKWSGIIPLSEKRRNKKDEEGKKAREWKLKQVIMIKCHTK